MPWTPESFRAKHNHGLSPAQAAHASHIANRVLESTGNEGEAIATGNKLAKRTPKRAAGGGMSGATTSPWWTKREATGEDASAPSLGFLHGPTPGRADALDTSAPAGSHVIPADVVAGLGQGNSLAGAARMEKVIRTGPGGMSLPHSGGHSSIPHPPAAPHAKGGEVQNKEPENTPVLLSHGEYVVPPHWVRHWGKGNQKAGHDAWDRWIVEQRKKHIKTLKNLPGPVKS